MRTEAAQAAKTIKQELAGQWPKIKFSVKSDNYAGGNSVDVRWAFGPTARQVEAVIQKYQHGSFDGMTDCYNYSPTTTRVSAKYVFAHRDTPGEIFNTISRDYAALLGEPMPEKAEAWNHYIVARDENIATLTHQLVGQFELPNGYQGIERVVDVDAGQLTDFYALIGGTRQDGHA